MDLQNPRIKVPPIRVDVSSNGKRGMIKKEDPIVVPTEINLSYKPIRRTFVEEQPREVAQYVDGPKYVHSGCQDIVNYRSTPKQDECPRINPIDVLISTAAQSKTFDLIIQSGGPVISSDKIYTLAYCKKARHINRLIISEFAEAKCSTCFGGSLFSRKIVKLFHKKFEITLHFKESGSGQTTYYATNYKLEVVCHETAGKDTYDTLNGLVLHIYKKLIKIVTIFLDQIVPKHLNLPEQIMKEYKKRYLNLPFGEYGINSYAGHYSVDINNIHIVDDSLMLFENT